MAFNVYCDNKECKKEMSPVIDKNTSELYCTVCGEKLNNQKILTDFAKRQLVTMNQVRKVDKQQKAWSVKCESCSREAPPELDKADTLSCSYCKQELKKLSKPYAQMLKQQLMSQRKAGQ